MRWGYFFISPLIMGYVVFLIFPLIMGVYFAFCRYDLYNPPKWVGLENFKFVLQSETVAHSWAVVLVNMVIGWPITLPLHIGMASLLTTKLKSINFFRTLYYFPSLTPGVTVVLLFVIIFEPDGGIANYLLDFIGLGPYQFIYSDNWFVVVLSTKILSIWKLCGNSTLYYLAAFQSINGELLEAASIDGAGAFKQLIKIKIPLISPTIYFMMITSISSSLQVFDLFYLLSNYTTADLTTVNYLIFKWVWVQENKVGRAAALGWVVFAVTAVITFVQKKLEKKWVFYG